MPAFSALTISGYRNEHVPNTFIRQERNTHHVALVFPGYGYRATMPALYYPQRILATRGADVLVVEYAYDRCSGFPTLPERERHHWLMADVRAACDAGLAQRSYSRITLVGKSLGTAAMGDLLRTDARMQGADCVWLTPLLRRERLRRQIIEAKPRSLFVVGTADGHYDSALLAEVERATKGQSVLVEGANHSLEIPDDLARSLQALEQVVAALETFLR